MSAHEQNNEQLRQTVQRQADTVDSLHAAAQKYRSRLASLEQQLVVKQAEIDSMKVLTGENTQLREQNGDLREQIRELEQSSSRLTEQSSLGAESQAQLGVKLQAYQRHNNFLQGEVALRESKVKAMQEKLDVLNEEVHAKDRRVSILVEKLRQHNIDPSTSVSKINVPEEVFSNMKQSLATQGATIDLLHEKLEGSQDEASRRETVIEALQKENSALRGSVSRLIQQINHGALNAAELDTAASPISEANNLESKLKRFHEKKAGGGSP